jgi:hypothetical protein
MKGGQGVEENSGNSYSSGNACVYIFWSCAKPTFKDQMAILKRNIILNAHKINIMINLYFYAMN